MLKAMQAFGLYLYQLAEFTMSAGEPTAPYVCDLNGLNLGIVKSTQKVGSPELPTQNHPDVIAFQNTTGTRLDVNAINYSAGTVTVQRPTGTSRIRLYFLGSIGEVILRAIRPSGNDDANPILYRSSLRALHERDQLNDRTAPTFDRLKELGGRWTLALETNTPAPVKFDQYAPQKLKLPAALVPVSVLQGAGQTYDAKLEVALRGGTLQGW